MPFQPVHLPQPLLLVPPLPPPLVLRTENGQFGAKRPDIGRFGDCVFTAHGGRVVEVETGAAGVRGNVTIDHHPFATGLVSRYLHLEGAGICVEEGDSVAKGDLIGRIGSGPADPHLHFELRMVLDPSDQKYWSPRNSIAVDPTRLLSRFEADLPLLAAGGRRPWPRSGSRQWRASRSSGP